MIDLEGRIKKAIEKLDKKDIGIIYLYGSFAEGKSTKLSDIDIGIVFSNQKILKNSGKLNNEFFKHFAEEIDLPYELDIIFLQDASLELQYGVICKGKPLYFKSREFKDTYEENVINNYLDFQPVRATFDKAMMERFKNEGFPYQ